MKKIVIGLMCMIHGAMFCAMIEKPKENTALLQVKGSAHRRSRSAMDLPALERRSDFRISVEMERVQSSDEAVEEEPLLPRAPLHVAVNMDDENGQKELVIKDNRPVRGRQQMPWKKMLCAGTIAGAMVGGYFVYKNLYGAVGDLKDGCDEMKAVCGIVLAEVAQVKPTLCAALIELCEQVPEVCGILQGWCFYG